ncbi:unnamed protein product [Colias eurytheme]|nr:unnamed protein product [Colias eurytheme]
MQARCQLQRRPTFLPSNFYFLRARRGGRSHHATNYESSAKCSTADIRTLAPPSGSAECCCRGITQPRGLPPRRSASPRACLTFRELLPAGAPCIAIVRNKHSSLCNLLHNYRTTSWD